MVNDEQIKMKFELVKALLAQGFQPEEACDKARNCMAYIENPNFNPPVEPRA